jgi:hypothetical protein
VGVGVQREAGAVMPQHAGHRFHVHAVLEGQSREGVTEISRCQVRTKKNLYIFVFARNISGVRILVQII